jgi:hypothetical protein
MQVFKDREAENLTWVAGNPRGYVVNCYRNPSASYLKLHRATCAFITSDRITNYTTRDAKACALDLHELERWAVEKIGGGLSPCSNCNP